MDRVERANEDILKYLITPQIHQKGQDKSDKIAFLSTGRNLTTDEEVIGSNPIGCTPTRTLFIEGFFYL